MITKELLFEYIHPSLQKKMLLHDTQGLAISIYICKMYGYVEVN